jgi:hypothetical protein
MLRPIAALTAALLAASPAAALSVSTAVCSATAPNSLAPTLPQPCQ